MGHWFLVTGLSLALVLLGERLGKRALVWVFKPLASAGFIGGAVAAGAFETAYGHAVFLALAWSMAGDILLIPRHSRPVFAFGIMAFLISHLGYAVAFRVRGLEPTAGLVAGVAAAAVAWVVWRWLRAHLPRGMRVPVLAYIIVISLMVAAAFASYGDRPHWVVLAASLMFYLSDLAVARQRFVAEAFANRLVGLPLYYGGQCLFAASVAWAA